MNDDTFLSGLNQEDIDHANRLEFSKDYEALDKFWNEMDLDAFNTAYFSWMASFEDLTAVSEAWKDVVDVNYQVVDDMFEAGITPDEAVIAYWLIYCRI